MSDRSTTLAENIRALGLESSAPNLSEQLPEGWRVEWEAAWPALSVESEDGRWLTLASRRAPLDEARAQSSEALGGVPWPSLVILLGAGLGYAVDVIESEAPAGTRVLVIEPFAPAVAAMLARRDWRALVDAGRLRVLVGPGYDGAADLWRQIKPEQPPLVIAHPVLSRIRPAEIASARRIADRAIFDAAANAEARETLGGRYLVNTIANLPRIVRGADLRAWTGRFTGQPAVVCGAGPSLNRNLRELAPHRDAIVLIATDTALRPMLEAGFEPELVVALDPAPLNARHLSGLALARAWLVSEAALDPAAFDSFGDRVAFFRVGDNDPWPWLGEQSLDVPILPAWGSVLTSAFALAELLGSDPIALAGSDLSYTGGQPYCRGTMFEVDWARAVLEGQPLPKYWQRQVARRSSGQIAAVDGSVVESAPHLIAFCDWLVDRAAKSGRRVVNFTGAGILTGGPVEQLNAGDVLRGRMAIDRSMVGRSLAIERPDGVAALRDLSDDEPPLSSWIASYERSLDRRRLRDALEAVGPNFSSGDPNFSSGTLASSAPRALIALPEALAILRAVRDGGPLPVWAAVSSAWQERVSGDEPLPVAALLRRRRLGTTEGTDARMPPASAHLHLLFDLQWPQAVLESAAALAVAVGERLRRSPPGAALRQRARGAGTHSHGQPEAVHSAERRARAFVVSLWAAGAAAGGDGAWKTVLALMDAVVVALDRRRAPGDALVAVRVQGVEAPAGGWCIAAPLDRDVLAGALRGALLGAPGRPELRVADGRAMLRLTWRLNGDDRDLMHREYMGTTPHRVLTDEGLPKCLMAVPGPDGTAIVTPRGQQASYRVGADGAFAPLSAWPSPVVGEVHGPRGQMAWTYTTPPFLLFRENADVRASSAEVTFQTYTAAWWHDRVVLTTNDGLWTWQPGSAPKRLAELPPAVVVSIDGDDAELDPLALAGGRLTRARLSSGWRVDLAAGAVSERSLLAPGQRWSEATSAGITAITHPQADVVRLQTGKAERHLIWPAPRTAIWLGDSLLLNTAAGEVVLFPNLRSARDASGCSPA